MIKNALYRYLLPAFIVFALGIVTFWYLYNPVKSFKPSVPGMDERKTGAVALQKVNIGETFTFYKTCDDIPGTRWPRFRGADFDNVSKRIQTYHDNFCRRSLAGKAACHLLNILRPGSV